VLVDHDLSINVPKLGAALGWTRRMRVPVATLLVVAGLVLVKLATFAVRLNLPPLRSSDAAVYASIARSQQLHGVGIPSIVWFSPTAVDHIPFYGPVYFNLVAWSYDLFGPSLGSFRIVSLLGTLVVVAGAGALAAQLSGSRLRCLWAAALILWTPSIGTSSTSGDMETIAVGFELLALAAFVRGFAHRERPMRDGVVAGVLLLAAALTTPRTYPFVVSFFVAGALLLAFTPTDAGPLRVRLMTAFSVFAMGWVGWTVYAHGGPDHWLRYFTFITAREDTDVAVLSTSVRNLAFHWSSAVTPAAAAIGGASAVIALYRTRRRALIEHADLAFSLTTAWIAALLTVWGMNLTFTLNMYFAIPLFAVVLGLPRRFLLASNGFVAAGLATVVAVDVAATALRWVRIAATWQAKDQTLISEFVRSHVPAGSGVVGPGQLYFFPVEQAGARYRSADERSPADWARWVPEFDPSSTRLARTIAVPRPTARFLMWQAAEALPVGYECAQRHLVATFVPPPNYLSRLGPLGNTWDVGVPATSLYRLPPECPSTFDVTGARQRWSSGVKIPDVSVFASAGL
jgi:hypothetical protein